MSLINHDHDAKVFQEYISSNDAMYHLKLRNIKAITADVTAIITTLHQALPKRKPSSARSGGGAPAKAPGLSHSTTGNGKVCSSTLTILTVAISLLITAVRSSSSVSFRNNFSTFYWSKF